MSLLFDASTEKIDHGSDTTLDNLNPATIMTWVYPTTVDAAPRVVWSKPSTALKFFAISDSSGAGRGRVRITRATTTQYITNSSFFTANEWQFAACAYDTSLGAGAKVDIWRGTPTALAVEATYATTTEGSGAVTSDAAGNAFVGQDGADTFSYIGRIAWIHVCNTKLSLTEVWRHQFMPWLKRSDTVLLCYYNATIANDRSGHPLNNGTITGATAAPDPPILWLPGWQGENPYTVTAPATGIFRLMDFGFYYEKTT